MLHNLLSIDHQHTISRFKRALGKVKPTGQVVGAWGCFDEFSRLEERMLSAVSQQIQETLKNATELIGKSVNVPIIYVDYPDKTSLKQIYGTFNRAILKIVPSLRANAEPFTAAMVEFDLLSQEQLTQDMQPHYVYSPRELTRWMRGIVEAIRPLDSLSDRALPLCSQICCSVVFSIKKQNLVEVKSMTNLPTVVKLAMESICLLLGEETTEWKVIRSILMRDNFISTIANFQTDNINEDIRQKMISKYLNDSDYNFEKINRASLVKWSIAQVNYADMLKRIESLRNELLPTLDPNTSEWIIFGGDFDPDWTALDNAKFTKAASKSKRSKKKAKKREKKDKKKSELEERQDEKAQPPVSGTNGGGGGRRPNNKKVPDKPTDIEKERIIRNSNYGLYYLYWFEDGILATLHWATKSYKNAGVAFAFIIFLMMVFFELCNYFKKDPHYRKG